MMKSKMKNDIHGGNPLAVLKKLGLKKAPEIKADFSVNINPVGSPPALSRALLSVNDKTYSDYPEIYADTALRSLAKAHDLSVESILVGNGSTELFSMIIQSLNPAKIAWIAPSYSGYSEICSSHGVPAAPAFCTKPEDNFKINLRQLAGSDADMFFLCTPNNPTGAVIGKEKILAFAAERKNSFFIVDESFIDFLPDAESKSLFSEKLPGNIILVKSLTKFFSIAGVRLGVLYANPSTVAKIAKARLPWSVNAIAQKVAPLLYSDEKYIAGTRRDICELRKSLSADLAKIPALKVYPAHANFLLCELRKGTMNADKLQAELLKRGILIRSCSNWQGLGPNFFRLAVLDRDSNNLLISELKDLFSVQKSPNLKFKSPHHPIMIVGTGSGSGKSVFVSALCRYFVRKGLRVAPFKAQNMSLNSFVTREGGEMGRAQVVQAQAAKIEPHTDMNPVLLKPTGDAGSQLIVNGKATCNVTAKSYYAEKCELRNDAFKAFDRLSAKYDLIILEGAGSPAEINLQDKDFVNMAMAEHAKAKTILVADIDKGGVFASIYGTIALIPPRQRKLIAGVVINKFRGDVTLLKSGIEEIEKLTGVPVLGVLPFIKDLRIEEEDSLGLEDRKKRTEDRRQRADDRGQRTEDRRQRAEDRCQVSGVRCQGKNKSGTGNLNSKNKSAIGNLKLEIAVLRLPRISNYTDFLTFETLGNIEVTYVENPKDLGTPDIIFIPGSKNSCSDMQFLRDSGFEKKIKEASKAGTPVFGICGGYQMLGTKISDPYGVEGKPGSIPGLGLLPVVTVIEKSKELSQVSGLVRTSMPFASSGTPFTGYEIHMGKTSTSENNSRSAKSAVLKINQKLGREFLGSDGCVSSDGLVFGTYIHGIFDRKEMRDSLIKWLCSRKGINPEGIIQNEADDSEESFEKLADMVEKHLDLKRLN
jgi:cobyric acid synthase/histidinol-phosphate/aromatic aminotransferase/cobyric acid decarboxylase-like protein